MSDSFAQHRLVGHSDNIDASGFQSFIGNDTTFDYPTAATAIAVASSDANDTSAGTGARTIRVHGLDANYVALTEDFTLNGQTEVTGSSEFLRINQVEVLTAGSGGVNAGTLYVGKDDATFTLGVPDTMYATVDVGFNRDTDAQWTTPAGTQALLHNVTFSSFNSSAKVASFRVETRDTQGVDLWVVRFELDVVDNSVSVDDEVVLTEKTDIRIRVDSDTANTEAAAVALLSVFTGTKWVQG